MNKLTLIAAMVIVFAGCKKYDEGPAFSLVSKNKRIVNNWQVKTITVNGEDLSNVYPYKYWYIKDGGALEYWFVSDGKKEKQTNYNYTWSLDSKKEKITIINTSYNNESETLTIVRLKSKEMVLEDIGEVDGQRYTYRFEFIQE